MIVAEGTLAELALWLVASLVYSHVLSQVGLLSEALITVNLLAYKGTLARMNSQVVEEVVPFAEEHVTVLVVALEDLNLAHRARILVLEDAEAASLGHGLVDLDRA